MNHATVATLIAEGEPAVRAKLMAAVRDYCLTREQTRWYAACWHAYSELTSREAAEAVFDAAVAGHAAESRG